MYNLFFFPERADHIVGVSKVKEPLIFFIDGFVSSSKDT